MSPLIAFLLVVTAVASFLIYRNVKRARFLSSQFGLELLDAFLYGYVGYLRKMCDDAGIEYERDSNVQGLFGVLRQKHPAFRENVVHASNLNVAIRSSAIVLEALNHYRNRASLAHSNEELIGKAEAMYMINIGRSVFNYLHDKLGRRD